MSKKHGGLILRLIVTVLIVVSIVRKVRWEEVVAVLRDANLTFILLSLAIVPVMLGVSVWKWHVLIKKQGIHVTYGRLFLLYLYGNFFNHFLPSSVGGDVVVWYELGVHTSRPVESVASIFMNRFTGLVVVLLGSVFALFANVAFLRDPYVGAAMGLATATSGLVVWFVLDKRILPFAQQTFGSIRLAGKFLGSLKKFQVALNLYRGSTALMVYVMFISVIYFVVMGVNIYLGARAFNLTPSLLSILVVLPFIQIIQMLPISIGGIGLKEWAYTVAFPYIGVSASAGLSVALFVRTKMILTGILGGLLYPLLKAGGTERLCQDEISSVGDGKG